MEQEQFDYPVKSSEIFWYMVSPMLLIFLLVLIRFGGEIFGEDPDPIHLDYILLTFAMAFLITPLLATLAGNSFPAVRVCPDCLEIRFYFPRLSRWIKLPWDAIERIDVFSDSWEAIQKKQGRNLFIKSRKLPFFYAISALLFRRTASRGVMILDEIDRYDVLIDSIRLQTENGVA
jgi:hypothetical protein